MTIHPSFFNLSLSPRFEPSIKMIFGGPEGRLITTSWGDEFKLEGNIRLAALSVLEHALRTKLKGCLGQSFSRFEFDYRDGAITVKPLSGYEEDELTLAIVEEIRKLLKLMIFW